MPQKKFPLLDLRVDRGRQPKKISQVELIRTGRPLKRKK